MIYFARILTPMFKNLLLPAVALASKFTHLPRMCATAGCWALLSGCSHLQAAVEQAKSSDDFVESIGIGTHLAYSSGPYGQVDTLVKPRLSELGVRHVRDGVYPNSSAGGRTAFANKVLNLNTIHHPPRRGGRCRGEIRTWYRAWRIRKRRGHHREPHARHPLRALLEY